MPIKIYPYDYIPTRINTDLTDFLLTHPVAAKLATISVSIRVNPCGKIFVKFVLFVFKTKFRVYLCNLWDINLRLYSAEPIEQNYSDNKSQTSSEDKTLILSSSKSFIFLVTIISAFALSAE